MWLMYYIIQMTVGRPCALIDTKNPGPEDSERKTFKIGTQWNQKPGSMNYKH
jgi:hypothetical protein